MRRDRSGSGAAGQVSRFVPLEIGSESAPFVDQLLRDYLADPASVPSAWARYFSDIVLRDRLVGSAPEASPTVSTGEALKGARLQDRVEHLIRAFRVRGHLAARLDPLGLARPEPSDLAPEQHDLSADDMHRTVSVSSQGGDHPPTVGEILQRLRNTYCRYIGVQFMHIDDPAVRTWLQQRMERSENRIPLTRPEQIRILKRLTDAVLFEEFVRKKYVGAKTFSLEGSESLIPLLDLAIAKAAQQGIAEIVLGMAHRGRLNVLANIIGKRPEEIFREFDEREPEDASGSGDLAYHLGYSSDWQDGDGHRVHLSLCFNPSHLEFIDPVAIGRMRAKQDRAKDVERTRGMTILIHGDAAFAGEGVVQETLNLSQLAGYQTGGTLHVIVNNQLGFTTSPTEGRSTVYASDIAKMLQIPIFHVNGEHPESVAQVIDLAMDFRATFHRDVVIDLYGYRRFGHNETDEPGFTHPLLYQAIGRQKPVRETYLQHLVDLGGITREEGEQIAQERSAMLQAEFEHSQDAAFRRKPELPAGIWEGYLGGAEPDDEIETSVDRQRLADVLVRSAKVPDGFHLHRKLQHMAEHRVAMAKGTRPLDWSAAEALALATLALEGHRIRLSGQDSQRGTFSQRHAVLHDVLDGREYCPLANLATDQAPVEIINSPLSETGVLGFEYGYSLDCPEGLIAWEAQFGDFVNAGQVIIDQFLAAAAQRWRRLSGLVLLLPHGFEGMGPEHSSARLERFLSLAAQDNMQIVYPTTPAQYFHVLRRQVLRTWRTPLIVMTPKSLLRSPEAVSTLEQLSGGGFRRVLPDERKSPSTTSRVLLCTGKVYYDLAAYRTAQQRDDVAIVRIEELYPLRLELLQDVLRPYPAGTPVFWVQEEPTNMGARTFLYARFGDRLFDRYPLAYIARPESASPTTGSKTVHKIEQERLIVTAFSAEKPTSARSLVAATS